MEPWLGHTVRQCSAQAHKATAVTTSIMTMDESIMRCQGTPRARQRLVRKPEGAGIETSSIISYYNSSFAGVDRYDTLAVPQQSVLPEDVLR